MVVADLVRARPCGAPSTQREEARLTLPDIEPPTTQPEDFGRLIVAIAERRDRAAFAELFRHFAPRVKAFLMRSGLAGELAEEIAQETLAAVWRKAPYFDPARGGAATWIFTIARNRRIDCLRRGRSEGGELDPTVEPVAPPSTESLMISVEREAQVRRALESLSPEQATIMQMSFFAETPHSEIARELGIPLGTVKSRVRLAMQRLRVLLEEPHGD